MKLTDVITTAAFAFLFAFFRCLGRKWRQTEALGQGLPLAVGMLTLYANPEEHQFYQTARGRLLLPFFFRVRCIDDTLRGVLLPNSRDEEFDEALSSLNHENFYRRRLLQRLEHNST